VQKVGSSAQNVGIELKASSVSREPHQSADRPGVPAVVEVASPMRAPA
jgi:hypothetical protein